VLRGYVRRCALADSPRRLAGADLVLEVPKSLAERWDVVILGNRPGCEERAHALALGLCWPRFRRRHPYRGDALGYSTLVIDTLLNEGAAIGEILGAGMEAGALCVAGLVRVASPDLAPFSPTPTDRGGSTTEP
jgi:hypothetical protein